VSEEVIKWRDLLDEGIYRERKFRLYCCGACRLVWDQLSDPETRRAIEVAERFVEGEASVVELRRAGNAVGALGYQLLDRLRWSNPPVSDEIRRVNQFRMDWAYAARGAVLEPNSYFEHREGIRGKNGIEVTNLHYALTMVRRAVVGDEEEDSPEMPDLWREVFGNVFGSMTARPEWRTSDVLTLARGIYEDRAFDRMPILADALQDAGCDNTDVLDHCRGPGPHVRGCWVVDLILGKT
jgi:hypothetical protein